MSQSRTIVDIQNLCVWSGKTSILKNVHWTVENGQHWAILGANGSGKTSLLNTLTAYLTPSRGTLSVLGQTYGKSNWPELRKHIGVVNATVHQMIPQDEITLETIMSGKYAMIGLWKKCPSDDRKQAQSILRQIECSYLAKRPWRYLSQGERQRVLIGRALMAKPQLLILDEPCAGLDPLARELFLHFLQKQTSRKKSPAFIFVTHHVEEIIPAFTHILVLKNGEVLTSGKKRSVLKSNILSRAFHADIRIQKHQGRFYLKLSRLPHKIT